MVLEGETHATAGVRRRDSGYFEELIRSRFLYEDRSHPTDISLSEPPAVIADVLAAGRWASVPIKIEAANSSGLLLIGLWRQDLVPEIARYLWWRLVPPNPVQARSAPAAIAGP